MPAPQPRLRLASARPQPVVTVSVAGDRRDMASGHVLCLVPPLSGTQRPVAAVRSGDCDHRRVTVKLAIPGVGARYLARVGDRAAAMGWGLDELAALTVELERRCVYLLAADTVAPLSSGRRRLAWLPRQRAVLWDAGRWCDCADPAAEMLAVAHASGLRGYACTVAVSGAATPHRITESLDRLADDGVSVRPDRAGVAGRLGARWAAELLGTPPLSAAQLHTLRERFAAAPRCDWCGIPVIGKHCHRCTRGTPA